jgi:hypothetical protein
VRHIGPHPLVGAVLKWRARRRASRLEARFRDLLHLEDGHPQSFLKEAVRILVVETAAVGAALYIRDAFDAKGSLEGVQPGRWTCVAIAGSLPPPEVPDTSVTPGDGRSSVGAVPDGHLTMRLGEIPDIGRIGVLFITPSRGVWARAVVHEGLAVAEDLLSLAVVRLWLRRREEGINALVRHSQVLPQSVADLTLAADALRPLTEAAEVQRIRQPEQLRPYHAAVNRALIAVDRLVEPPGPVHVETIDIIGLIRERLSVRPPTPAGEPICTARQSGPHTLFGDRAGLAELIDRLLDYIVATGGSPGNVEVRRVSGGPTSSIAIVFAMNSGAGRERLRKSDGALAEGWRSRCEKLVVVHSGQLEFRAEAHETVCLTLPVRSPQSPEARY